MFSGEYIFGKILLLAIRIITTANTVKINAWARELVMLKPKYSEINETIKEPKAAPRMSVVRWFILKPE